VLYWPNKKIFNKDCCLINAKCKTLKLKIIHASEIMASLKCAKCTKTKLVRLMEITWKFVQPPLMNFESLSHKLVFSKHVLQNILPFSSVTHGNDFVQLWQKNFVIASIVHTVVLLPRFVFHTLRSADCLLCFKSRNSCHIF
jgi:hypothetical protein